MAVDMRFVELDNIAHSELEEELSKYDHNNYNNSFGDEAIDIVSLYFKTAGKIKLLGNKEFQISTNLSKARYSLLNTIYCVNPSIIFDNLNDFIKKHDQETYAREEDTPLTKFIFTSYSDIKELLTYFQENNYFAYNQSLVNGRASDSVFKKMEYEKRIIDLIMLSDIGYDFYKNLAASFKDYASNYLNTSGAKNKKMRNDYKQDLDLVKYSLSDINKNYNALVEANLKLVINIAKTFKKRAKSFQFNDLIQEGNIGLMKSVWKFNPYKGYKLSTYSTWWIRQSISRSLDDKDGIIRISIHKLDEYYQTKKYLEAGGELPVKRKSKSKILSSQEFAALEGSIYISSLSALVGKVKGEETCTLEEIAKDEDAVLPEDEVIGNDYDKRVALFIDRLLSKLEKDLDRRIIIGRFGLDAESNFKTLDQIGKENGYTRERIRQRERDALKKFKRFVRFGNIQEDSL